MTNKRQKYSKPRLYKVNLFPKQTIGAQGCKEPDIQATTMDVSEDGTCGDFVGMCIEDFGS